MSLFNVGSRTESEVSRSFATETVDEGGRFILQVTSAYDSYAVNPEDVEDPTRKRYIHMRIETVDVRRMKTKDFEESKEQLEARRSQIGRYADVYVRLEREGHKSALEGRLGLLCAIAGTSQPQFEHALDEQGLLKKAFTGVVRGEEQYDIGIIADEIHVNCSRLVGRLFGGEIEVREHEGKTYYDLNPWRHFSVADDAQQSFMGNMPMAGDVFVGEDTASKEAKERFAQHKDKKDNKGGAKKDSRASARPASNDDNDEDDFLSNPDTPF